MPNLERINSPMYTLNQVNTILSFTQKVEDDSKIKINLARKLALIANTEEKKLFLLKHY